MTDADPVLEAVAALRATGVAVAPIGDELERWQIGDLEFGCRAMAPRREPRPGRAWRRTFPGTHHDFVAETREGEHVGRIKRIDGGPQSGTWTWSCTGCQRGHEAEGVRPLNGMAPTRDEAIEALATAWDRAKAWSARPGLPLA